MAVAAGATASAERADATAAKEERKWGDLRASARAALQVSQIRGSATACVSTGENQCLAARGVARKHGGAPTLAPAHPNLNPTLTQP